MSIPLDDRRAVWAWFYGERAFKHCKRDCDHILKNNLEFTEQLCYALNISATIHYGRPFKHSNGLTRLDRKIIPSRYLETHTQVLRARDKLYAHVDTGADSGEVSIEIEAGMRRFVAVEYRIIPSTVKDLASLCAILIGKCNYHLDKLYRKHANNFPEKIGKYRIGVGAADPEFIPVTTPRNYFHDDR